MAQSDRALEQGDATNTSTRSPLLVNHDTVVSASRFQTSNPNALVSAVKEAGIKRLLVVGGAASLMAAPGKSLIDMPDFPDAYKLEAHAGVQFFEALRNEKDLEWTFLSPSA